MNTILGRWRDSTLRPRAIFANIAGEEPRSSVLLYPMASGMVQAFGSSSGNDFAESLGGLLLLTSMSGAVWGLVQVHLVAWPLWIVSRRRVRQLTFPKVRHMASVAATPMTVAFLAWVMAAIVFGPALLVDVESVGEGAGVAALLAMAMLYLGAGVCLVWNYVLLFFGVRALLQTTTVRTLAVMGQSFLLLVVTVLTVVGATAFLIRLAA